MDPFRRFSLVTWALLCSIPPLPLKWLVMPVTFLLSWTLLSLLGLGETQAFVLAAVLAQAVQIWVRLPLAVHRVRQRDLGMDGLQLAGMLLLAMLALQLFWAEPWLCQRILSLACAGLLLMLLTGALGHDGMAETLLPWGEEGEPDERARGHLLKLSALIVILIIAVNEILLRIDAPLDARVATLSLLPLPLHALYWIGAYLSLPLESDVD